MREAGAGRATFVDYCVEVSEAFRPCDPGSRLPRAGCGGDLRVRELGQGAYVPGRMDNDFLALERRVEVRDNPDLPARGVRLPALGQRERLRRCPVLAALVEGAPLALFGRLVLQPRPVSARPVGPPRRDDYLPPGKRVDAKVDCQLAPPPPEARTRGPMSSIGSGRISVDVRSELISSIVCR
jgi:hypothetical protein